MNKNIFLNLLLLLCASIFQNNMSAQNNYPKTRRDETVIDNYSGTKVADPYRWLEDDNATETKKWVTAQNANTYAYLEKIPYRDAIKKRLTELWNYEKYGSVFHEGDAKYFFKNDGLQNQAVLYRQTKTSTTPEVFLDPNTLSKEGTVALGALSFSKDGKYAAYQLAKAGSDWQTIYIKEAATGKQLDEPIEWVKFSGIAWQGNGFYYSRFPKPELDKALTTKAEGQLVYYHMLGTPVASDKLMYSDEKNPKNLIHAGVSDDARFVCVSLSAGTSNNSVVVRDEARNSSDFKTIIADQTHDWNFIDNVGDKLYFLTNYKASNRCIIGIDFNHPEEKNWKTIIAEHPSDVIESVDFLNGKLVLTYMHNVSSLLKQFDLDGSHPVIIPLPGIGTIAGLHGKRETAEAFFNFTSFMRPSTPFKLDMKTLQSTEFKKIALKFNPEDYTTEQVFYKSKDGTQIPMFVTMKRGAQLNGKNPTILYGYGGFNISLTPSFSVSRLAFLERGGIYAVANIRGGGEFGSTWHEQGTLGKKQNVFDDFIAAAEFLIAKKYTSSDFLAISGGSNGGLLVGACLTQRPDLFRVALPAVGVLDMLRYHQFTIGRAWATDYGLSEMKEGFDYLYKYSPLQNIKPGTKYPATLITTGDHDDRVVPAHSFKFAATLQSAQASDAPILIRIETSAGHGAGKPTAKVIQEATDVMAFTLWNMGVKE